MDGELTFKTKMVAFIEALQEKISCQIELLDGSAPFLRDCWTRSEGGFGKSFVLQNGAVFEKAAINVSVVEGTLPPSAVQQMRARRQKQNGNVNGIKSGDILELPVTTDTPFFACGISSVMHPHSPHCPTVHFNFRYFETPDDAWFGGGCDLSPSYIYDEDCVHFHRVFKEACDMTNDTYYPRFKIWCDDYFKLSHRQNETRGIGGVFFDDLPCNLENFQFVQNCGYSFLTAYVPIIERRKNAPVTPLQKEWQQLRRGRYVEFNLIHDRGTKFGLLTPGARIESILCSMPLTARWEYLPDHILETMPFYGQEERRLIDILFHPRDWLSNADTCVNSK